jgi:GNAT superfamily N-acetyltransferase
VVDLSTTSSPEGEVLPAEGEVPSSPFDGIGIAYPPDGEGETATVDGTAATTTGNEVPQDQPIEGEDAVNISDSSSTSTGLKGFVQGLLGGKSSEQEVQETTTENMEEQPIDIAEERREAEVPSDEAAAAPDGEEAAQASEKSRRLGTEDMLRQAVQQEQEAEVAARRAAENDEPHKATLADADEMRRKAIRKVAMEQAAELARNRGIPTTPKAPDVLELQMPED